MHDGGGFCAALEILQFLEQLVLVAARQRLITRLGAAIGAMAVGTGGGLAAHLQGINLCPGRAGHGDQTCGKANAYELLHARDSSSAVMGRQSRYKFVTAYIVPS